MEEKQRFHTKKKEAWEFSGRLPSFKPKKQEEFEEEFKRKVMTGCSSGSPEEREKILGWVDGRVAKESVGGRPSIGSQGTSEDGRRRPAPGGTRSGREFLACHRS